MCVFLLTVLPFPPTSAAPVAGLFQVHPTLVHNCLFTTMARWPISACADRGWSLSLCFQWHHRIELFCAQVTYRSKPTAIRVCFAWLTALAVRFNTWFFLIPGHSMWFHYTDAGINELCPSIQTRHQCTSLQVDHGSSSRRILIIPAFSIFTVLYQCLPAFIASDFTIKNTVGLQQMGICFLCLEYLIHLNINKQNDIRAKLRSVQFFSKLKENGH